MKSVPVIGARNLEATRPGGQSSLNYQIVVARKQTLLQPNGKRSTVVVFERVSRAQLDEDRTGKTAKDAKRAISILKDRMAAQGLPSKRVKEVLRHMFVPSASHAFEVDKRALDGKALDALIESGKMKTGKTRFADAASLIPDKPVAKAPLPAREIILPELPDDL